MRLAKNDEGEMGMRRALFVDVYCMWRKLLAASWCKFKYMGGVCKVGWVKYINYVSHFHFILNYDFVQMQFKKWRPSAKDKKAAFIQMRGIIIIFVCVRVCV